MTNQIVRTCRNLTLGAASMLMLGTLGAVSAQASDTNAPQIIVKYDAQSLATSEGVHTLYRRIESAAREVCPEAQGHDPVYAASVDRCRAQAVARAVTQINDSRLANVSAAVGHRG